MIFVRKIQYSLWKKLHPSNLLHHCVQFSFHATASIFRSVFRMGRSAITRSIYRHTALPAFFQVWCNRTLPTERVVQNEWRHHVPFFKACMPPSRYSVGGPLSRQRASSETGRAGRCLNCIFSRICFPPRDEKPIFLFDVIVFVFTIHTHARFSPFLAIFVVARAGSPDNDDNVIRVLET